MPESPATAPSNPLRDAYRRARELSLSAQLRECADGLGHPQVLTADLAEAFEAVARWTRGRALPALEPVALDAVDLEEIGREDFYSTREIAVVGEPCAFTCLASDVDPLAELRPDHRPREGLDYLGVTCDATHTPVLGTVQSLNDVSAYPLLLRGLACLAEMAAPQQLARMNRSYFLGRLADPPAFDLDLVVWDLPHAGRDVTALEQLTRDLAEAVLRTLHGHQRLARLLRHIVCLRMNPERFDGRLTFLWRV
jgi:hypothetical protein